MMNGVIVGYRRQGSIQRWTIEPLNGIDTQKGECTRQKPRRRSSPAQLPFLLILALDVKLCEHHLIGLTGVLVPSIRVMQQVLQEGAPTRRLHSAASIRLFPPYRVIA
jgi:hypothetical protein